MSVEVGVILNVHVDPDWYMEVSCQPEQLSVTYREAETQYAVAVNFSSVEEMRAVAKAMLAACDTFERTMK